MGSRARGAQRRLPEARLKTACETQWQAASAPRTCGAGGYVGEWKSGSEDGGEGKRGAG